jgi:hypothetical protein
MWQSDRTTRSHALRARRVVLLALGSALVLAGLSPAKAAPHTATRPFEMKLINGLGAGEPQVAADPVHHTVVVRSC